MWFIGIALLVVLVTSFWFLVAIRHPKGFPPGPRNRALPIIGDAISLGNNIVPGFDRLSKEFGPVFGLWLGPFRAVVISDYDTIVEASAKDEFSARPRLPGSSYLRGGPIGGECPGIILASGQPWLECRRFALHHLKDFGLGKQAMEGLILDEVTTLCDNLTQLNRRPVDARDLFQIAILNALWKVVTGESFRYDDVRLKRMLKLLDVAFQEGPGLLSQVTFLYTTLTVIVEKLHLLDSMRTFKELMSFVQSAVNDHKATFKEDHLRDFIDVYLQEIAKNEGDHYKSGIFNGDDGERSLVSVIMDLFIAGSETTSTTLSWAMLFMLMNPEVKKRVQDELDEARGEKQYLSWNDRSLTPYTEAVIHEVQRLGNTVNFAVIHRVTSDTFVGKYFFPKETNVFFNLGDVMIDPAYFSKPKVFNPMRFINDQGKFVPHPRVIPFGLGKRRCIGETLAKIELYLFFTGIMSKFEVKKVRESDVLSLDPSIGLTLSPKRFELVFVPR